ncbi:MAG: hypothetical protein L6Q54_04180 [Leptospiraceae bacterium]|nr:CopG family transcriptional regulator [Leptospiraceae bacterium]MCK6380433.1 hypothetical protein [Leptospiraceae bacterium]NUM40687.1 CopG family transcriptional regulator [Leptospiraceae bacterium]
MKKSQKTTKANLEERFDAGKSVIDYFDLDTGIVRVNVDFPKWMVNALDKESKILGIARQSLVKMWIADKIDSLHSHEFPKRSKHRNVQSGK